MDCRINTFQTKESFSCAECMAMHLSHNPYDSLVYANHGCGTFFSPDRFFDFAVAHLIIECHQVILAMIFYIKQNLIPVPRCNIMRLLAYTHIYMRTTTIPVTVIPLYVSGYRFVERLSNNIPLHKAEGNVYVSLLHIPYEATRSETTKYNKVTSSVFCEQQRQFGKDSRLKQLQFTMYGN